MFGQFGGENEISASAAYPIDLLTFDFDSDGDDDIVSFTNYDGKVSLYENLGGNLFSDQKVLFYGGIRSNALINEIDVDNDGDYDFIFSNEADDIIGWYENLNNIGFSQFRIISTLVDNVTDIHTVDVDNDGDEDLLSITRNDKKLAWYENLGNGNFGNQQVISTYAYSQWSIHSEDLDGDGDNDIVCGSSDRISWHENLGGGVFSGQNVLMNISSPGFLRTFVDLADFDNDGDIDIAYIREKGSLIGWYENNGFATFSSHSISTFVGGDPKTIKSGDFNNDGFEDIVVMTAIGIEWYQNYSGIFSVTPSTIPSVFDQPITLVATDFDNDFDDDIASISAADDKISFFECQGNGLFSNQRVISKNVLAVREIFTADFDNDSDIDIVSVSGDDNKVSLYTNLGGGVMGSQIIISDTCLDVDEVYGSDLDNDSDIDVLAVCQNKIIWFENLGGNSFSSEKLISAIRASDITTGDMDNDGDEDVIAINVNGQQVVWFQNIGGGNIDSTQISVGPSGSNNSLFAFDYDFDGIDDVFMDGHAIYGADMDNDNDIDILRLNGSSPGNVQLYENLGAGNFSFNYISSVMERVTSIHAEDLDGDGFKDIICAGDTTSFNGLDIVWFKSLGGNSFSAKNIIKTKNKRPTAYPYRYDILAADMDNDGDNDVIHSNFNHHKIVWYENFHFSPYQLKGNLYYDANQNKVKDTNEIGLSFIQMQIQPTGQSCYTAASGEYIFAPDTGSYVINYVSNTFWGLTTDSVNYNRTLTGGAPVVDSLDFGFYPDSIFTSVQADLTGAFPRCNENINYWIDIQNKGTTLPSGIIHLQLDDSIAFVSATSLPDSIVGQNIYWNYDSLNFYSNLGINVQVTMPPFTSMGDTLESYLRVNELDSLGNIIYTNLDSLQQVSVCAYDPNDKSVLPKGIGVEGYIPNNEPFLEYLIRFQNTGNDTAITIMVRDQLDSNLDWNSMQIISSSHILQAWIEQDGEAVFKFENIMLPDSGADFNGSQGYIKFRISLNSNIISGTQILNTSHIYFDNNPAVITNITLNTIYDCGNALVNVVNSPTCLGENLIANSPEGSIINYFWEIESFYNDSSSTLIWQSDTVGTFNLKLTINNPFCSKDTTTSIVVYPALPILNTNQSICQGDSVQIGGLFYSTQGIYGDTLQSYLGCDSILSINLSIDSSYISNQNQSICQGDSILIFGTYRATAGLYYDSLQTINGCDSILTITLNVDSNYIFTSNQSICQGDSILIYGKYESVAGIYYDSLQTITGCDSVLSTTLTIDSLPNVSLSNFNPDTLCVNSPLISLPSGTPSGGNYSGTGVGGSSFDPAIAGVGTHQVIYTYTDSNSCVNSDTTIVTVNSCVGISEQPNDFGILIYPNPNTGLFTIEKPSDLQEAIQIILLDASSKLILEKVIPVGKQKLEMDITNLSNGVYYLQLVVGEEVFVKKILKD